MTPVWWLPLAAFLVDAAVGDPRWLTHPVVIIGRAISFLQQRLRGRAGGVLLTASVVGGTYLATVALIRGAGAIHPLAGSALEVWLFSTTLAARSLAQHALAVCRPLSAGDLPAARQALSMVVGRDTLRLEPPEIVRGAVETVAESTCDGVIAPFFWGLLGGAPLAMAYKAANTLDSMVGHKDERYLELGWASARLDDLLNLIPARLSALLLAICAGSARGLRIALRDSGKHPSPNSGWPEAAVAGALGVRLGGVNCYDGVPEHRAFMGDPLRPLAPADIPATVRLMYAATTLAVVLGTVLLWEVLPS